MSSKIPHLGYCRIYQVYRPDLEFFHRPHSYIEESGRKAPPAEQYHMVFSGNVVYFDLEDIFFQFNQDQPHHRGFTGHSMMVSDILEIRDIHGSKFYYCDVFGFQPIQFDPSSIHKEDSDV